jgi:hypothetical protein
MRLLGFIRQLKGRRAAMAALQAGNAARDARSWAPAAASYERYLKWRQLDAGV